MSRFKLLYFVIFIINLCRINAQISDKRLCVDEECKVPISLARTLLRYSSPDSRILSFAPNVDITIYSKSAGSRTDLWGGEINGKRGYVPKHLVRETKILEKPTILVDTEFSNDTQVPSQVEPDKVQEPYEVVDGTTIYTNPQEIEPTSTEIPIQSTALPGQEPSKTETPEVVPSKEPLPKDAEAIDRPSKTETPEVVPSEQPPPKDAETIDSKIETASQKTETDEERDDDDDDTEDDDFDDDDDEDDDEDETEFSEKPDVAPPEKKAEIAPFDKLQVTSSENKVQVTSSEEKSEAIVETSPAPEAEQNATENAGTKQEEILEPIVEVKSEVEDKKLGENSDAIPATKSEDSEIKESSQAEAISKPSDETVQVPYSADVNPEIVPIEDKEEALPKSEENEQENKTEEVVAPQIEVTTFSPEIEVPNPFEESLAEVTQNPVESVSEEAKIVDNIIPTLPPLGLFGHNLNENLQTSEEVVDKIEDTSQPIVEDFSNENVETTEFSFKDESIEIPEKNESEEFNDGGNNEAQEIVENTVEENDSGFFSGIMSMFRTDTEDKAVDEETADGTVIEDKELTGHVVDAEENLQKSVESEEFISKDDTERFCDAESCQKPKENWPMDTDLFFNFNSDVFLYLVTTAVSVIIFLFGYIAFDKSKREGPLVGKINNLEKELLIVIKENQILQDRISGDSGYETNDRVSNEAVENLKLDLVELTNVKNALEEQVQSLEKELENSTEVGMELNRMLSEILSSESGSDVLKANVEHLQRQLVEQQATINSINETLAVTNTENHELRLELDLSNKKVVDLQTELDKLLLNVLKIEEEKEAQQSSLENEVATYKHKFEEMYSKLRSNEEEYSLEVKHLKNRLVQTERNLELKTKEVEVLTETFKQLKAIKSNDGPTLQSLLDMSGVKAEVQLLKTENQKFSEKLRQEEEAKLDYQKTAETAVQEVRRLKEKYDEADRLKVETETKLEVLSNYFKDKEAQLQKEITKHESLWMEKQGEATSTTERIKFMQDQLQNYKSQTESLKQEIVSQEVELKSQISVLEKKAHENWVSARQAERKLEEAKQEAAQLRHRLTLRERAFQEDKNQHRYQSPIEQNGDMPISPLESPASPPLLYGTRDHITKSPPIPGLPPFLPPPPGVPFMPPPLHGVPPFIPPPPTMFPGDHRPPPLGRMSSPPLNSRYSPSSRGYSPYDSSPSDSEYGTSPPQRRGYSPFSRGDDPREYKRPQRPPPGRINGRNIMKDGGSSGSGHSNESLEKISRQQSKV